jgi:hypothetical protein
MPDPTADLWSQPAFAAFHTLNSPRQIQDYLDQTPYSPEEANRCPLSVIRDRLAHCLDGGLFAAAALRRLGYPPLIVDLLPEPGADDDHVLAIFKERGRYGAVAKSNYVGLRYREPVYKTLRELVMSYFEFYFYTDRKKTLRGYTRPVDLSHYDHLNWMTRDAGADVIEQRLKKLKSISLIDAGMAQALTPVDDLTYAGLTLGINLEGVYKPKTDTG